ncbi:MAG: DEAD/DEAH box helicase [Candidatus Heimdallarchaeota archaeon]|nr:DEAD/DEAH box helicase [Candidatus Heimdallarchaeota archaeon]
MRIFLTEVNGMLNHPFLEKGIEARLFQQTILNSVIRKNTLVVLPTGTGKTMISILHIAYLLEKGKITDKGEYVLILAPTKPLVHQHVTALRDYLTIPSQKIVAFSGAIRPDKRAQLAKKACIIVATPQTIKNDIIQGHIDLRKCVLIYFDEAHRATGDYSYVPIADILVDFNPSARIVALTASPGADKESILEICRNLFIEEIESRTKDDPEVSPYVQEIEIDRIEVPLPQEFEELLQKVNYLGEKELQILKREGLTTKNFSFLYKGEVLRLKQQLSKNFRGNYLEVMACNRLIYLQILRETLESQGIPSTHALLENWLVKKSKSIQGLLNLEVFQEIVETVRTLDAQGTIHPKLLYLFEILKQENLDNSRVLIFCNLRATCYAISKALNDQGFNSRAFVGQSRGKKKGLSQKKQIKRLDAFRNNAFSILVSTSVLEEGLDVEECNLVIFYDSTPSAIRKIQRVGRTGRKKKGRVIVLTTHQTTDTAGHFISKARERRMKKLLADISWLKKELEKEPEKPKKAFTPIDCQDRKDGEGTILGQRTLLDSREEESNAEWLEEEDANDNDYNSDEDASEPFEEPVRIKNERLRSFKEALEELQQMDCKKESQVEVQSASKSLNQSINQEEGNLEENITEEKSSEETTKENSLNKKSTGKKAIKIIVDSREKNSKILFYLKKQGIELDFQQLENGDYILSDRVAVEYKKGADLLASIIDGRLFEQLGHLQNAYQIPILLIEGFSSGGIHPEAIAGAIASFAIDFGVSVIQTQSSQETAALLRRLAIREQKTKKRKTLIRKPSRVANPKENVVRILSSFPGINRTISTRLLEKFGSIKNIINSKQEELKGIDGLGDKKSKIILRLANYDCSEE